EQKQIELSDGSELTLNTASQVLVDITDGMRRVVMDRGEVYFEIAGDPLRPFIVELQGRSISVLGTEFSLRRTAQGFSLALVDGVVSLHRPEEKLVSAAQVLAPEQGETVSIFADGQYEVRAGTVVEFNVLTQQLSATL